MIEMSTFSVNKRIPSLAIPIAACSEDTTRRPGGVAPRRCPIWRGKVRNPSWGLLSLEQGTRAFLTGFGSSTAFVRIVLVVVLLFQVMVLVTRSSGLDIKVSPSLPVNAKLSAEDVRRMSEEINRAISNIDIADTLFCLIVMLTFGFIANSARKCKEAMKTGDVLQMKRHFYSFVIFSFTKLLITWYAKVDASIWILLVVPYYLFTIMGLLFTYNYIREGEYGTTVLQL